MLGPSGVSMGTQAAVVVVMDVADIEGGPVTDRPPGPRADRRRLWVSSARGLVWSMNWDRGRDPKNSLMAAVTGRILIRLWGDHVQVLNGHSLPMTRSIRLKPMRNWFWISFAHAAQAAVAQVVNVVGVPTLWARGAEVVDGGHDVRHGDVLGHQVPCGRPPPPSAPRPEYWSRSWHSTGRTPSR